MDDAAHSLATVATELELNAGLLSLQRPEVDLPALGACAESHFALRVAKRHAGDKRLPAMFATDGPVSHALAARGAGVAPRSGDRRPVFAFREMDGKLRVAVGAMIVDSHGPY